MISFATKNDLPSQTRSKICELIHPCLCSSIDLGLSLKQAHWNVKGPHFIGLHGLFDDIYESVEGYTDDLAERIVQLGSTACGTLEYVNTDTLLPKYPVTITEGSDHLKAVSQMLSIFGGYIRPKIDVALSLGDNDTSDLFIEISRGTDKWLWQVEAHLQGTT